MSGRALAKEPDTDTLIQQLTYLEQSPGLDRVTSLSLSDHQSSHRSIWAFHATDQACADCHNRLQGLSGDSQWQLGDLMGAQVVDQDVSSHFRELESDALQFALLVFMSALALMSGIAYLYRHLHRTRELRALAMTDSLTGCLNRRALEQHFSDLQAPASGALLMLDIDHFKKINDSHGHDIGDAVIRDLADRIRQHIRNDDWVARVGGEEFVIWLPGIGRDKAADVARRIREQTESGSVDTGDSLVRYTVSIGLFPVNDAPPRRFESWIKRADELLYLAKREGRNRVALDWQYT